MRGKYSRDRPSFPKKSVISEIARIKGPDNKRKRLDRRYPSIEWTFYGYMNDGTSRKWQLTYDVTARRFRAAAAFLDEQEEKYFAHMGDLFPVNWREAPAKKHRKITDLLKSYLSAEQIAEALAISLQLGARK